MVVFRGLIEGENGELLVSGYRVSVLQDEIVVEVDEGDGCTTRGTYLELLNCQLKSGYNERSYVIFPTNM